ncbi:MAG: LPS export ABC transporter periplasmic protein LptC [Candidatus Binatia bacterium]
MRRQHARLAVLAVIVASLSGVGYLVHSSLEAQKDKQVDRTSLEGMLPDAVQWIQNFHRIEIREGKKAWELEADEAQYLQESGEVLVRRPRTSLYMKDGERVSVQSEQGKIEFKGKDLYKAALHDSVEIRVRGFVVRAKEALYDREADSIVAKGPVTIESDQLRVAGTNMTVFVKESRFELDKPVHVTLLPKAIAASPRS